MGLQGPEDIVSALLSETWLALKLFFRDKQYIFWNYAFFIILQVIFCTAFGQGEPGVALLITLSIICITIIGGALYGLGVVTASQRGSGIFKRYKTLPVPLWVILGAPFLTRSLIIFLAVVLELAIAIFFYKVRIAGSLTAMLSLFALGTLSFAALGLLVGSAFRAGHVANAVANTLMLLMILLGGIALPVKYMPVELQMVSRLVPASYLLEAMQEVAVNGAGALAAANLPEITVLFLMGLASLYAAGRLFRYE